MDAKKPAGASPRWPADSGRGVTHTSATVPTHFTHKLEQLPLPGPTAMDLVQECKRGCPR